MIPDLALDATAMLPDTSSVCLDLQEVKEETGTVMLTLLEVNGKEISCIPEITGSHFLNLE